VKEIRSLLLSTLLLCFTLFSFTGCEDKKVKDPFIPVENTTEVFTQEDKDQQKEKKETIEKSETKKEPINKEPIKEEVSASQTPTDTFTLSDIQQNKHTLTVSNQKMAFHNVDQSIVIINFFSTWCSPCRAEIPYLSDLQKKYKKKVFIAGILVNDEQSDDTLKQFMSKYQANYFISNSKQNDIFASKVVKELQLPENFSIPLTVIYKDGNYYTHYEGAVPVEMIDHDIQEAIKE
jgi:thiol-disulfide isomerase/thioredoxin